MPGCCIENCKNRTEGGYRLFNLPRGERNEERKKQWLEFINRPNVPAKASICEIHFEETQFETKRADGRKLLKWNAIPTIRVKSIKRAITEDFNPGHSSYIKKIKREDDCLIAPVENETEEDNFTSNLQFELLIKELKAAKNKINYLENKLKTLSEKYRQIFNEDQLIVLLTGNHRGIEWSEESINKGLRLYMACGARGYEEVRKQNIPYPSIRTLQHRVRDIKFDTEPLEDILKLLELKVIP